MAKHIPGRTGQQCAQRWRHRVNPDIKKEKWSAEEDRTLLRLVHQHGSAWAEISRGLEARACPVSPPLSRFTASTCTNAWQAAFSVPTRSSYISSTPSVLRPSSGLVCQSTLKRGRPNTHKWMCCTGGGLTQRRGVARAQGRTDQQCMGRWRRHLDPKVKRDAWSPQEDARLADLVGHYGGQWSRICRHVKSRTAQQCRARCGNGGVRCQMPDIVRGHCPSSARELA